MITYAIVAACFVFCAVYNGMPGGSSLIKGLFVPICAYVIMAVSLNLTVGILGVPGLFLLLLLQWVLK